MLLSVSAADDSFAVLEDTPLWVQGSSAELRLNGDGRLVVGNHVYTRGTGGFGAAFRPGDGSVHVDYVGSSYPNDDWWSLDFAPKTGEILGVGTAYEQTAKYPGQSALRAGFDLYGNGHQYVSPVGSFTVVELSADDSSVTRFAAEFRLSVGLATDITGSIRYGQPESVMANDSGPSGLTATFVTGVSHGTLNFHPDGTFEYVPDANYFGTDSFTYTVSDGVEVSAPATVTLTVIGANDPPGLVVPLELAVDDNAGPVSLDHWATVWAGDGGEVGPVTVTRMWNSDPSLFSVQPAIDGNGRLTFTPARGMQGTAQVAFVANDGTLSSPEQVVKITVNDVPDAPVGVPDRFDVPFGGTAFGPDAGRTVLGNDVREHYWDVMTAELVSGTSHGAVSLSADGRFTYASTTGYVGEDSFTYRAMNGSLASAPVKVTLNVLPDAASTVATGVLQNVYPGTGGAEATTPLALRTVYDDVNNNGAMDAGEPSALTGLDGRYALQLQGTRTHVIRPVVPAGWSVPAGRLDYTLATVNGLSAATTEVTGVLSLSMTRPVVVDVIAFYPSVNFNASHVPNLFVEANRIYANSDTNVRINFVGAIPVKYASAGDFHADLARLASPHDGVLDSAISARDAYKADLAVLFEAGESKDHEVGLGYLLDYSRPDGPFGYSVVAATGNDEFDGSTLAHEMGHNLGADHDADNGPVSSLPYARGYRFTGSNGYVYRDVMAYEPGAQLPFFSTPRFSFAGHPMGDAADADNARAIREWAYFVASFRGAKVRSPDAPPAVTASSVTAPKSVTAGKTLGATARARNNAKTKFSGKVKVAFYLSKDRIVDGGDTLLKRTTLTAKKLPPGATLVSAVSVKLGAKTARGKYYVLAVATTSGNPADELAAKPAAVAIKVVPPPKRVKAASLRLAGRFQSAVSIVES